MSNLLDVHTIDTQDLELNLTVFLWPQKIIEIFDLSDEVKLLGLEVCKAADLFTKYCVVLQILVGAKRRGEQELLAKRERLKLELEKLRRRTDEFPHYSELDMIQQVQ